MGQKKIGLVNGAVFVLLQKCDFNVSLGLTFFYISLKKKRKTKEMKRFLFFGILLISFNNSLTAQIALYNDGGYGTWQDGLTALEQFLDWKGVPYGEVNADTINNSDWASRYQAICFPGGYAYYYKLAIDSNGIRKIREFVSQGGGYLGICAGAYFASDSVVWEEDGMLDYPLDLFDGVAIGAIDSIAAWDNYTMTQVDLNSNHPINQFEPASEMILYYGGPYFRKHPNAQMDTVGKWYGFHDLPGIITCSYGQGRVLLMGPHPEIEEDSDRDSTTFADELDDDGSDWPFLWSAVDWLLGQPVTYPEPSAIAKRKAERSAFFPIDRVRLYPNPFNGQCQLTFTLKSGGEIDFTLFNVRGQSVKNGQLQGQTGRNIFLFDFPRLSSGMYFLRLKSNGFYVYRKLVIRR